ncbi:MAG TPA: tetratricopeptide repeat protein [Candidatus Sulfotelmatobacter sp.]|nr:tetratricopeptide repeat protein [Candidatus Sulfotelmatobacter sp.]
MFATAPAKQLRTEPGNRAWYDFMFAAPGRRALALSLLLIVLTLTVYKQAIHFPFINFDDDRYVTQNPQVQSGLSWQTVKWALTSTSEANWHPLTWMSHALDCQWFGLNPAGHHLTSILLHALSAVWLFLFLWSATRRMAPSFFVAAIFALHPVNVESVVWIAERKNVLSTMFFLLTLGAYVWYAQKPDWKRYLAVASLFVAGLASKPMLVTLPFVLLLLDYWPLRRFHGSIESGEMPAQQTSVGMLLIEKLPLFALSAASALVTIRAQRAAGAVIVSSFPLAVRLKNAFYCYLLYSGKAIWPAKLAPLYPHPGYSLPNWKPVIALLFLAAVSALVVKFRAHRYLAVGWLWFLGTLVPVIGIVQAGNQAMADRYAYIPLIGLFVIIAWAIADAAERLKLRLVWKTLPAVVLLAALSAVAYRQIGYWRSSLDLWGHTLRVTKNNFVAEDEFGGALAQLGRTDEAYPHFVRAARLAPTDPVAHTNIGFYLYQHGRAAEAVPHFKLAATQTSDARVLATTYADLGSAYYDLRDDSRAQESFERSLQLNPNQFSAWLGMGLLAERQGKLQDAMRDFAVSLKIQPNAQGYLGLGRTLAETGNKAQALTAYELALKMSPDLVEAQRGAAALRR